MCLLNGLRSCHSGHGFLLALPSQDTFLFLSVPCNAFTDDDKLYLPPCCLSPPYKLSWRLCKYLLTFCLLTPLLAAYRHYAVSCSLPTTLPPPPLTLPFLLSTTSIATQRLPMRWTVWFCLPTSAALSPLGVLACTTLRRLPSSPSTAQRNAFLYHLRDCRAFACQHLYALLRITLSISFSRRAGGRDVRLRS